MPTKPHHKTSPLFVKSRPPSLVVDRFLHPASEDDLRLAASVHLAPNTVAENDAIDAKLLATRRELREAARSLIGSRSR